ncbi:MAG: hypothetical protein WCE82_07505 [Halobacteriota archaeon]
MVRLQRGVYVKRPARIRLVHPFFDDMPKKTSTTVDAGRFLSKLTNPQNPPLLKLAIFVSVVILVTFLLWLLTWLNLL